MLTVQSQTRRPPDLRWRIFTNRKKVQLKGREEKRLGYQSEYTDGNKEEKTKVKPVRRFKRS